MTTITIITIITNITIIATKTNIYHHSISLLYNKPWTYPDVVKYKPLAINMYIVH